VVVRDRDRAERDRAAGEQPRTRAEEREPTSEECERAIEIAKRTNEEKAINWHVSELSEFRGWRRYGVAMCIDVLFHIMNDLDWHKALSNLEDMVVEDGYLLIQDALAEVPVKVGDPERTHVNFRTEDAYREALNGWELLEHDSYRLPAEGSRKDLMVFRRFVP